MLISYATTLSSTSVLLDLICFTWEFRVKVRLIPILPGDTKAGKTEGTGTGGTGTGRSGHPPLAMLDYLGNLFMLQLEYVVTHLWFSVSVIATCLLGSLKVG